MTAAIGADGYKYLMHLIGRNNSPSAMTHHLGMQL